MLSVIRVFCCSLEIFNFNGNLCSTIISIEVSRSPKVGLPISGNLGVRKSDSQYQEILESESRTPNIRKSRSPNVSCEVSPQIGLIIRPKPYSSDSSVIKVLALRVAPPRFKSHPAQLFYFYFF